jgi:hypothetical protein
VKGRALRISNAIATTLGLVACVAVIVPLQTAVLAPPDTITMSEFELNMMPIGLVSIPVIGLYLRFTNDPREHIPLFLRIGGIKFAARAAWAAMGLGFLIGGFRGDDTQVEGMLGLALLCGAGLKWAVDEWRFQDDYPVPLSEQLSAGCGRRRQRRQRRAGPAEALERQWSQHERQPRP